MLTALKRSKKNDHSIGNRLCCGHFCFDYLILSSAIKPLDGVEAVLNAFRIVRAYASPFLAIVDIISCALDIFFEGTRIRIAVPWKEVSPALTP